jgi:hypothetical protein
MPALFDAVSKIILVARIDIENRIKVEACINYC